MVNKLKSKLIKSVKSKRLNVFSLFLILSFLFLVMTKLSRTYTDTIDFNIRTINVPEQNSITSQNDSVIEVAVKAYGFSLLYHNFLKHEVKVNFKTEVKKAGSKYYWKTDRSKNRIQSQLRGSVEIISIQPDTIVFDVETMAMKVVPVKLNAEIQYASGYDILDKLIIDPDSIKVIGPKNEIAKIKQVSTNLLKLKDVSSDFNKEVLLDGDNLPNSIKVNIDRIRVKGKVEKFTEGSYEVPVTIVNLPSDVTINYFPKTVLVSYYVSLEKFKNVKALDFKVECDYSEVKNSDKTFFLPKLVAKSDQVKSAKLKQNKVEFIIIE